jgi:hypothetical protein
MSIEANNSQILDSYLPAYYLVPDEWEDGRTYLVEQLKRIANAVNAREICWFLDEEVISGKQFFPGTVNNQAFRTILRVVVDFSPLGIGTTSLPHHVTVDSNFSLIELWASGTNATGLTGGPINQPNITYTATDIVITSTVAYTRCYAFMEYIQEL